MFLHYMSSFKEHEKLLKYWGISLLDTQHQITKWTTDVLTSTLKGWIIGRVDQINGYGLSSHFWIVTGV